MKKALFSLLAGLAIAAPAAQATIIGFEELNPPGCCSVISGTYNGFTWLGGSGSNSWIIANESSDLFSGTDAHSGTAYAWSNGGTNLTLSGAPFTLDSLWIRMASGTQSIAFTGFTGGIETFSSNFTASGQYQKATLNFTGIDLLRINSAGRNILVDDISVNASAIPEPATGATILLGLGLLGFIRRRAKAK